MKMKNIFYTASFAVLALLSVAGCYSIDDTQKEWTDKGETIYVGKLDSLEVRSGMNRVEIVGDTRYLRTAKTCTVTYEVMDEQGMTVEKVNEYVLTDVIGDDGKARLIVDGLESGSYYFDVLTFDSYGNKSVPSQVYGVAYGEEDVLVETPRRLSALTPRPDCSVNLEWNDATSTYVELKYVDADGAEQTMKIEGDPVVTNIESWMMGGKVSVQTFILKNETDLDMIALDPIEYTFPTDLPPLAVPRFDYGSKMDLGGMAEWDLIESFTVEVRVRYTELASGDQCIISCEAGRGQGFMLRGSGSKVQFYIGDGGWSGGLNWGPLETDRWYDLAVTYAPGRVEMYVDGERVAEGIVKTMQIGTTLQLGTSPTYSNRYMRGDIQHVSIWKQVKTADEIKADVEAGYGFTGDEEGLKAYWPLTQNWGSPLPDQTGQREAVLTGITWNEVE